MCIALPALVTAVEPGHAWVETREGRRRVSTALVGPRAIGDWLLVFLDSARGVIDARRAAEVEATLDLVQAAMQPAGDLPDLDTPFELPSALDPAALARLTGQPMEPPSPGTTLPEGAPA